MKQRKNRESIQQRGLWNILSLVALIVAIGVVAFSIVTAATYYNTMRAGLETKATTTANFLNNDLDLNEREYYNRCLNMTENFADKDTIELQFINSDNRLVASSYSLFTEQVLDTPDLEQVQRTHRMASFTGANVSTGERVIAVSMPMVFTDGHLIGTLRFVTSTQIADKQIAITTLLTLLVGLAVLAVVFISSQYYFRSIIVPVAEITETAKRIAAGSYGVQIQKKYDDEIGQLADTINDMSNKIGQNEKMQTDFVSSVSHELRTPLTAITGWGETLLADDEMDPADIKRGISIILRESRRLTGMVEELLEFTRMQDGRFTLNVRECDIRADFEDTVFMYGSRLEQEGIKLEYEESDDDIPEIPCDPERMRQVFLNILDNAGKHGVDGKRIEASMRREDNWIVTRIRDHGHGIPENELAFVKKKFYKGSSKARGSGIGLAVCDEIVKMHGGTLTLENAEGGGCLVTVRLPIPEEEP